MRLFKIKKVLKTAVFLSVFLMSAAAVSAAEFVNVLNDGVNLRSGPGTNYRVLYELPHGYPLKVVDRKGEWLKVSDFENDSGWIFKKLVANTGHVIVKAEEANVRFGPGTNTKRIGSVAREVILEQIERRRDWVKVKHPQIEGWIYKKLLWP